MKWRCIAIGLCALGFLLTTTAAARAQAAKSAAAPSTGQKKSGQPPEGRGFALALRTEYARAVTEGEFRNVLLGARLDYRFSPNVALGGHLGYANLKGKDGRAHTVLPYVQLEYRVPVSAGTVSAVPLRFATGYLPRNGPVARISTGLAFRLGRRVDLVAEILSPMLWITHNQPILSLNLALDLIIRLD